MNTFDPGRITRERPRGQRDGAGMAGPGVQGAVRPVLGSGDQGGAEGVPLDVAQEHDEVVVILAQERLEPALPDA